MLCPHCTDGLVLRQNTDHLRDLGSEYELCTHCGGSGHLSATDARHAAKREADAKATAEAATAAAGACFCGYGQSQFPVDVARGKKSSGSIDAAPNERSADDVAAAGAYC